MLNTVATAAPIAGEMLSFGEASLDAVLGYAIVFVGLILLMWVVQIVGKIMVASTGKTKSAASAAPAAPAVPAAPVAPVAAAAPAVTAAPAKTADGLAPGSAGEIKLYDTNPRDAALIMAIVADKMQKPLNELKFVSIKEVK